MIDKINCPEDLKLMTLTELEKLAEDIRRYMVNSISKTGGHLSSNLGVVELTIAMHYVLNSPKNKFIFDVGHQSYVHKILTGRKDGFCNLRKYQGLSGFPKTSESIHDSFNTGHSSTSISAGVGIAESNKLNNISEKVYIVIGDGAMTGGMAYEALNHAGRLQSNIVVILNDNEMSISKNVGALSKSLRDIRINREYIEVKDKTEKAIKKIPLVSNSALKTISGIKKTMRRVVGTGSFFEELGFKYFGFVDGHCFEDLVSSLEIVDNIEGPVILHVKTTKGKGFNLAERNPEKFHGIGAFDIKTGTVDVKKRPTYSKIFGDKLVELGKDNDKLVAITAAMTSGTGLVKFAEKYPKRFFDVGIAEQHAVTFAGGLAVSGLVPVFAVYSSFLQRAYDQIIHDVVTQNLHVVFAIDRAGLVGEDGETHQGVFDISYLLSIPNLTVISPYSENEMKNALDYAVNKVNSPIAIRYPRGVIDSVTYDDNNDITKPIEIVKGENTCIISVGNFTKIALEVSKKSSVGVINPRILTEFEDILKLVNKYENIIVLEDGNIQNGYGTVLLNKITENNINIINYKCYGYSDFVEQGSVLELYEEQGITAEKILEEIKKFNGKN